MFIFIHCLLFRSFFSNYFVDTRKLENTIIIVYNPNKIIESTRYIYRAYANNSDRVKSKCS